MNIGTLVMFCYARSWLHGQISIMNSLNATTSSSLDLEFKAPMRYIPQLGLVNRVTAEVDLGAGNR